MSPLLRVLVLIPLATLLVLASCSKKSSPTAPADNGNEVPAGMARITGTVRDSTGAVVSDVALHVVYDLSGPTGAPADPMTPFSALFFDNTQVLYTECGGQTPIPDGAMVQIYWDRDANGPDENDPQPPLCSNPPDCMDGPPYSVNFTEFAMMGEAQGLGPGLFYSYRSFTSVSDTLSPSIFYARIRCADGHVLYTSQPVHLQSGPQEVELNFTCTPCNGAPGVPEWRMDQAYPNPATDSVTVNYSLRDSAQTVLSMVWPNGTHTDSLVNAMLEPGARMRVFRLGSSPNGLYTLKIHAGTYQSEATLLKNVTDNDALRALTGAAYSSTNGAFTLQTAAGAQIQNRGPGGESQGVSDLTRLKVVATKSGYQVADTTFAIQSKGTYSVNLTLRTH